MKEKGLEDMDWVIEYITEWIEKSTDFKVSNLGLVKKGGKMNEEYCTASGGEFGECNPNGCTPCCWLSSNRIELQQNTQGGR